MTSFEIEQVVALMDRLWPRSTPWASEVKQRFRDRLAKMPISYDQAEAALLHLKETKATSPQISHVMKVLEPVAKQARELEREVVDAEAAGPVEQHERVDVLPRLKEYVAGGLCAPGKVRWYKDIIEQIERRKAKEQANEQA